MKIKTEEELWEILGSLEKFNSFLADFTEAITRKVLISVPALVIHHIKNEHSYNKIKDTFFTANPELLAYQPVVAQQLNIVAAEHSDWDINKVFVEAGITAKKIIREGKNERV